MTSIYFWLCDVSALGRLLSILQSEHEIPSHRILSYDYACPHCPTILPWLEGLVEGRVGWERLLVTKRALARQQDLQTAAPPLDR